MEHEKKMSSIDMRTIFAKDMTKSQMENIAKQLAPHEF